MDNQERLNILIWGDVMMNGAPPVVRRVLTGDTAYDTMMLWVYFREILDVRRTVESIRGGRDVSEVEIQKNTLDIFRPILSAIAGLPAGTVEFCELGPTLFGAIDRLELTNLICGSPVDLQNIKFTGVERSAFLTESLKFLHKPRNIEICSDWSSWKPSLENGISLSRHVANYAMKGTDEFVDWLCQFKAFTATEVFRFNGGDFATWDVGLPITLFDIGHFVDRMSDSGWRLYLTDLHPDFHARSGERCLVARIFGVRAEVAEGAAYRRFMARHPGIAAYVERLPLRAGDGQVPARRIAQKFDELAWRRLARYKEIAPIWGPPQFLPEDPDATLGTNVDGLCLSFEHPMIAIAVEQALPDFLGARASDD